LEISWPPIFRLLYSKFIFGSCLHISRQKYSSLTCILAYTQKLPGILLSFFHNSNTLPSPHMISAPSKAKQYSDIQFDICFRGPCSCCNSKRRRHRMLHANFIWSMYLYLLFIVCVGGMFVGQMCACVRAAALRTFQIIYFGIGGCYLYLWDLRVKFSLGFPLRLRIGNWKC